MRNDPANQLTAKAKGISMQYRVGEFMLFRKL
jgi:hypothetical protein